MSGILDVSIPVATILRAVAAAFEVSERELISHQLTTTTVRARYVVYHLARRLTFLSYSQIGRAVGGREHSTIMQGERACAELMKQDRQFAGDVETVEAAIIAVARRKVDLRADEVNAIAAARRILSDPWRHAPATPSAAVIAMASLLLDLAEVAQGMRELLDVRAAGVDAPAADTAEIDAALTASLVSMLDELGIPSRHFKPALKTEEIAHVA